MTITVQIDVSEGEQHRQLCITVADAALADVRYRFNPSGLVTVDELKLLAAAFITKAMEMGERNPGAEREASVARTWAQGASMWAVAGATKGL